MNNSLSQDSVLDDPYTAHSMHTEVPCNAVITYTLQCIHGIDFEHSQRDVASLISIRKKHAVAVEFENQVASQL